MMPPREERWLRYQRYPYLLARVALVLGLLFVGTWLLDAVHHTVTILLVAFFLAYLLNPPLNWLESKGLGRTAAVWALLVGAILVFGLLMLAVVPAVLADLREMGSTLPARLESVARETPRYLQDTFGFELSADQKAWLVSLADEARAALPRVAQEASGVFLGVARRAAGFLGTIADFALVLLFGFYMMRDFAPLTTTLYGELVPPRWRAPLRERLADVDTALGGFVRGQLTVCAILAVLYTTGLLLSGVPLAFVIGPLAGLANIIPFFGFAVGVGLSLLVAVLDAHGWGPFIGIAITFGSVQGLEGFVLTPRIVGGKVGLSPFAVILALAIFGEMFGFLGVLLAVPIAAVVRILARDARRAWRGSRVFGGVSEEG